MGFSYKEFVGDNNFSGMVELDVRPHWVEEWEWGNGDSKCTQLFPEVCLWKGSENRWLTGLTSMLMETRWSVEREKQEVQGRKEVIGAWGPWDGKRRWNAERRWRGQFQAGGVIRGKEWKYRYGEQACRFPCGMLLPDGFSFFLWNHVREMWQD